MNAIHDKHMHDHQIFYMTCFEENMNTALYFTLIKFSCQNKKTERGFSDSKYCKSQVVMVIQFIMANEF